MRYKVCIRYKGTLNLEPYTLYLYPLRIHSLCINSGIPWRSWLTLGREAFGRLCPWPNW